MDIDTIFENIITLKISKDSSNKFALSELEELSNILNIEIEELAINVLKINQRSFYDLKRGNQKNVISQEYKIKKQEFFEAYREKMIESIIIKKISEDFSAGFTLNEIKEYSNKLNINLDDLCINVLKLTRNAICSLKRGDFKKLYSEEYKSVKQKYLEKVRDKILEKIMLEKVQTDFTSIFTYKEIEKYSKKFNINIRDLLGNILNISNYGKWNKPILKYTEFNSETYRTFKHNYMQFKGNEILDSFFMQRIKRTGTYMFDKIEIEALSKIYKINPRDFIVYVLGKTENTYYDILQGRTTKCISEKYKSKKDEILVAKKEKFMEDINPNIRTYYSLEELNLLAENLEISTYDLIVSIMGKVQSTYTRINKDSEENTKVFVGSYVSGPLPETYCKKNMNVLLNIIKVATFSALAYMKSKKYDGYRFCEDLLQEGFVYLCIKGNPLDKNGDFVIKTNEYSKKHQNNFYKKVYFNAISKIKEFCSYRKEYTGEVYDVSMKTPIKSKKRGYRKSEYEIWEDTEYADIVISKLSDDLEQRKILKFFSQTPFNPKTLATASIIFNVSEEEISLLLENLKNKLLNKEIEIE